MTDGGDKMVVASGGEVEVQSGGTLDIQAGATTDFSGDISLGDAITDNVYVYGQLRSYDGTDNWADIADVSALDRNNGWQAAYNITGWGGDSDFQAGFFNTQVAVATADSTIYGVEGKATLKGIVATGTSTGIGVMGKVIAKTTATWPEAYAVYGRLESDSGSDMITAGSAFMGDLDGLTADFGTVSVLSAESGDTWDYGVDLNPVTVGTADVRLSNGETIANTTNDVVTVALESGTGHLDVTTGNLRVGNGSPGQTQDGEDLYVEDMFEVAGPAYLGDEITDNIYVYGALRSYDGNDNWADVADVSALGRNNGLHFSYNVTGWGGETDMQAGFFNTQVSTTTADCTIYGVEAKATLKGVVATGTSTGIGIMGKVVAKTTATLPEAYAVYGRLESNSGSDMITAGSAFMGDLGGLAADFGTVSLLSAESGDTWDYGVDLEPITVGTADIRLSNGETIKNTTDTVVQLSGFFALEEATTQDVGAGFSLTPTGSYQPLTNSTEGSITSDTTTAIVDGAVTGTILVICNEDAQDIVLDDGANTQLGGNITLTGGADDCVTLLWDGTDWTALAFHDN